MTTFYLRLALLPIVLLTAVLLVIRSQPYDDHELRELLLPSDCPAPCFMGIRPGVTTVDEAVAILEASGWVKDLKRINITSEKMGAIEWYWNDKSPSMLNRNLTNALFPSFSQTDLPLLVEQVSLETLIPIGNIYLLLGEPYATHSADMPGLTNDDVAFVLAQFPKNYLSISSRVYCPVSKERFLTAETTFTWMTPQLINWMTASSGIDYYC